MNISLVNLKEALNNLAIMSPSYHSIKHLFSLSITIKLKKYWLRTFLLFLFCVYNNCVSYLKILTEPYNLLILCPVSLPSHFLKGFLTSLLSFQYQINTNIINWFYWVLEFVQSTNLFYQSHFHRFSYTLQYFKFIGKFCL